MSEGWVFEIIERNFIIIERKLFLWKKTELNSIIEEKLNNFGYKMKREERGDVKREGERIEGKNGEDQN